MILLRDYLFQFFLNRKQSPLNFISTNVLFPWFSDVHQQIRFRIGRRFSLGLATRGARVGTTCSSVIFLKVSFFSLNRSLFFVQKHKSEVLICKRIESYEREPG